MSFSSDCKKELCLLNPEKPCCRMSELSALYMTLGSLNLLGRGKLSVQFTGESMAVARRVYTLLQKGLELSPQIHYVSTAHFGGTRKCVLTLGPTQTPAFLSALGMMTIGENGEATLRSTSPKVNLNRSCCVRAFLRGAMLGGGTMTNPEQGYHLELGYRDENFRDCVAKCLQKVGLPIHQSSRKGKDFLYPVPVKVSVLYQIVVLDIVLDDFLINAVCVCRFLSFPFRRLCRFPVVRQGI